MKQRIAVYAASLDPITNGHIDIIERMVPLYDTLIVVVAVDPRKTYTFTAQERLALAKEAVQKLPNVRVQLCEGRYVVKFAEEMGAQVVIRGLRNFKDMEDEQVLAEENRKICPQIETIWVPCRPELMHVSSSMVRSHVGMDSEWEKQVARSVPPVVLEALRRKSVYEKARKHWDALMQDVRIDGGMSALFNDLVRRYSEPHRRYHMLEHIVKMLDAAEAMRENDIGLRFAVWFHDAVYDTTSGMNEENSAEFAAVMLKQHNFPSGVISRVKDLILATKHDAAPKSMLEEFIVDLDLMIFAASEEKYDAYEKAIREEYAWVPDDVFRQKRIEILKGFLGRAWIYSMEYLFDHYETAARANLKRAIERLQSQK